MLREDFGLKSDIDVLVQFLSTADPTLLGLAGLQCDLEDLFGRDVDLIEKGSIKPFLMEEILATRRVIYVAPH